MKMKLSKFFLALLICMTATAALAANPALPQAKAPVFITSFGQSQDSNFVNLLAGRVKLERTHKVIGTAEDPAWSGSDTFIAVIGGSSKGLGSAGLNISTEVKRCDDLMKAARGQKKYIIGMHIGGVDRRGPTSEAFLHYAGDVDYMIVKAEGNQDGYFTKLCREKNVPLYIIENTKELETVLKKIFGL